MPDPTVETPSPGAPPAIPGSAPLAPKVTSQDPNQPPPSQENGSKERKSGTLYDDLGEKPPGQGSAAWPEDWRKQLAGDDDKSVKALERYDSPQAVAKALLAAQQRLRSGEYKRAAPLSDKPEEIKAWREEQGIPPDAKGYLDAYKGAVDNYEKMDAPNKKIVDTLNEVFLETNQRPEQAAKLIQTVQQLHQQQVEETAAADAKNQEGLEDTLRADWGSEFRPNLQANLQFLDSSFGEELADSILVARLPDGRRLSDIPEWNKKVNEWARTAGADILVDGGSGGQGIEASIAEIEKTISTDIRKYENDPAMQKKYYDLIEKRDRLAKRK